MDASEITRRRRARMIYTNNVLRLQQQVINKRQTSGNQVFDKNGTDYTEWKNYITIGPTYISREEIDRIFPLEPQ